MTFKKLLVLDVNGLLIDTYFHKEPLPEESPDARVGNFYVYKRPFCEEFLQFCLENFIVGIWSSAREYNVNNLVDYVFGDAKERLAFSWHQSDCTDVGLKAPDNEWKPLFMKDLSKLWRKEKLNLPWSEGDYGPSNTLLVDDTPYKAVLNPPNTAIFPRSYTARDHGDNFLGVALRSYLEGIRDAASVQTYVENNPFGEPSITPESPLWSHVSKVLLKVQKVLNKVSDEIGQAAVSDDVFIQGRHKRWRHRKWNDHSGPPQRTNDDTRLFDDFPSEAIERQFNENVVPPLGCVRVSQEFHDSDVVEQAYKPGQSGEGSRVLQEADEEQSKDELPRLESLHMDSGKNDRDGKMKREISSSLQQKVQGAFESAVQGPMERGQLSTAGDINEKAHQNADAGINVELDDIHEEQADEIDGCGNENRRKVSGDSGFNPSKSHKKQELIIPRADSVVCASNNYVGSHDHSFNSDHSRDKHRRFQGEPIASHHKRNYHSRDSIDNSQSGKRQKECYQDRSKRDHGYGQYSKEGSCYQDRNRDSMGHGQNWKRERGRYHRGTPNMRPFNGRDQRRHISNSGHSIYEADEVYINRDTSFNQYARHSQERHRDRPVNNPAEYPWGNTRAPGNAVIDSNYSTQPYRSRSTFTTAAPNLHESGYVQGGFPSRYQSHSGFEPRVAYESSNGRPERAEDWNLQGWHLDSAKRDGGGSSEPHRDAGAYSQSYRRGGGASRLPYKSNGASVQWHHSNSDGRRNGWAPRGFSRSRQR